MSAGVRAAELMRSLYRRRFAAGVCARCGKVPPKEGRRSCAPCLVLNLRNLSALKARRRAAKICLSCGITPVDKFQTCMSCRKNLAASRGKRRLDETVVVTSHSNSCQSPTHATPDSVPKPLDSAAAPKQANL